MTKLRSGLLGLLALCAASMSVQAAPAALAPAALAPAAAAPLSTAVFQPETAGATLETVQYYGRPRGYYRRGPGAYRGYRRGYVRPRAYYRRGPGVYRAPYRAFRRY